MQLNYCSLSEFRIRKKGNWNREEWNGKKENKRRNIHSQVNYSSLCYKWINFHARIDFTWTTFPSFSLSLSYNNTILSHITGTEKRERKVGWLTLPSSFVSMREREKVNERRRDQVTILSLPSHNIPSLSLFKWWWAEAPSQSTSLLSFLLLYYRKDIFALPFKR